jgi:fatty acid desaturase
MFLLHAFVIGFLFSPLHECAHSTAFKSRWLNETVLWIVAIVYIVPPYYFRYFHLGHHRFTQVPGKDPSLVLPQPANFRQYLWYCAGLWFWWRNINWIIRHTFGSVHPSSADYVPKQRRGLMVLEARIMIMIYLFIVLNAWAGGFMSMLLVCWILPRFFGEPIQRIIRVAEHVGCAETPDLLDNTRTTLTSGFINALAWQMPYHAEHHLFPNVPFHQLPTLHKRVGKKVIVEKEGYIKGQQKIIAMLKNSSGGNESVSSGAPML